MENARKSGAHIPWIINRPATDLGNQLRDRLARRRHRFSLWLTADKRHVARVRVSLHNLVGGTTEAQRVTRIAELLAELHKLPPERHETVRVPWTSDKPLLDVIHIGVDEVLLNPQSHRIRAQLQDDPEWEQQKHDPYGDGAQRIIERHVRQARKPEQLAALRQSLITDGQTDPGVMTHTGLLINANTRAVALRSVENPDKRKIRVAVLPQTVTADELALLELRLQMQNELKVEYTMTNELLFIEELAVVRKLTPGRIALELRIKADSPKKGENEVKLRLKLLDLLRTLQKIPAEHLPLTFFDDRIKLEQLREVYRVYAGLVEHDPEAARQHLESFLLSIAVGIKAVHEIRRIDADFMTDYMLPQLEDDELLGSVADALVSPSQGRRPAARPPGVDALLSDDGEDATESSVDVVHLIDVVTRRDKRVEVDGTHLVLDQDDVKDGLKAAVAGGIADKRRVKRDEDQLAAPTAAVKQAIQQLARAREAVLAVLDDPEFDERRRRTLEASYKKLGRAYRGLEAELVKAGVVDR